MKNKTTIIHTEKATFEVSANDSGGLTIYKTNSQDYLNNIKVSKGKVEYENKIEIN